LFRQNARHEAHPRDENAETETERNRNAGENTGEEENKKKTKRVKIIHFITNTSWYKKRNKKNGRKKEGRKLSLGYTLGTHEKEEKNLGSSSKSSALTGTYHSFF